MKFMENISDEEKVRVNQVAIGIFQHQKALLDYAIGAWESGDSLRFTMALDTLGKISKASAEAGLRIVMEDYGYGDPRKNKKLALAKAEISAELDKFDREYHSQTIEDYYGTTT